MDRRTVTMALLLLFAGVSATSAETDRQDLNKASRHQLKGDRAMQAGNAAAAVEHYTDALELVPELPPAHLGLGHVAMGREQFAEALAHYQQARDGYALIGELLREIEMKRYSNSQREIQSLQDSITQLQTQSTNVQNPLLISQLENRISQLRATAPPQDNVSEAPGEVYFYIGNALFRLDRLEEAVSAWESCRRKSPRFAMVYNNLALAYGRQGKFEQAMASATKAEELGFPVNPQFKADLQRAAGGS